MKRSCIKIFLGMLLLVACKSHIKQSDDSLYSRHLQRHIGLTILTTPMPKDKATLNLLLFNNSNLTEFVHVKKIIDSLYNLNLIQPLVVVAFAGNEAMGKSDYGLAEAHIEEAKQFTKFNDFVVDELYPFIKKKTGIRKFNAVAICGFGSSALSAFDIAWNNDEKIQTVGMFYPSFFLSREFNDSACLEKIASLRKRPRLNYWICDDNLSGNVEKFKTIIASEKNTGEVKTVLAPSQKNRKIISEIKNFDDFLLFTFPAVKNN